MVNFKRKVSSEKDIYGGFDSVIEIDDAPKRQSNRPSTKGRSFADTYTQQEVSLTPLSYTSSYQKRGPSNTTTAPSHPKANETRQPKLHDIRDTRKLNQEKTQSLSVSSRTKVLLATYLIAAIVLAAVVITTGVILAGANETANALEMDLAYQTQVLNTQDVHLEMLHDDNFLRLLALDLDMEVVEMLHQIDLIEIRVPTRPAPSTNGFDRLTRGFARLFAR